MLAEEHSDGVLLYYQYAPVEDVEALSAFFHSNCESLSLLGRVRISPSGVNVTIGGPMVALESHISAVKSMDMFADTDFKLASSHSPIEDPIARDCGFTSLSIRVVKDLVTFRSSPLLDAPDVTKAGKHLSPQEFHSILHNADSNNTNDDVVLLDARNLYETRIGKFHSTSVKTLDPEIRQFSDLCSWIDDHSEQLRGKKVLMYCTGGVRCESASAYIKSKGDAFESVFQLRGGIQRYLEQYPDGGYFRGKNFVFDHRISVGSTQTVKLGRCLRCEAFFDDYSSRQRCYKCRMLVLMCDNCQGEECIVCELCTKQGLKIAKSVETPKKLRILCLHGFRQNASSFKGRTASFAKKLKSMVELVFIDGPHELRGAHAKRFAWLVEGGTDTPSFDSLQFRRQRDGVAESMARVDDVLANCGPFDGVLGFSQGAAFVGLMCAGKQRRFRFAVLCSGFRVGVGDCDSLVECPSLHIYGGFNGKDRQIGVEESRELAGMFVVDSRVEIQHESGHIVPTRPPYIDEIRGFLRRFI